MFTGRNGGGHDRELWLAGDVLKNYVSTNSGGSTISSDVSGWNDNEWHHVAVTLGANGHRMFVDGQLVAHHESVTLSRIGMEMPMCTSDLLNCLTHTTKSREK